MNTRFSEFPIALSDLAEDAFGDVPSWIFDLTQHKIIWGNSKACAFWQAETVQDLLDRDFSTDSIVVRRRLSEIYDSRTLDAAEETWTIYPNGTPVTVKLHLRPVAQRTHVRALVITVARRLDLDLEPDALRLLEASRHTPAMVSLYSMDGVLVTQNSASSAYVARYQLKRGAEFRLANYFSDPSAVHDIVKALKEGRVYQADLDVTGTFGLRHHSVTVQGCLDPVTGAKQISVSEQDVSDRTNKTKRLARQASVLATSLDVRAHQLERMNVELTHEVAERRAAEAALRDQVAILESFFQAIPAPVFYKDSQGVLLGGNEAFEEVFEIKPGTLDGSRIEDHIPDHLGGFCTKMDEEARSTDGAFGYEFSLPVKDGPSVEYLIHKARFDSSQTNGAGIVGIMTNIDTQKRNEDALRKSANRLETIARISSDLVWELDKDLRYCFVSDRCEEVTGMPAEAFLGKRPSQVFAKAMIESPEQWAYLRRVTRERRMYRDFVHSDGGLTGPVEYLSSSAEPIFDDDGAFQGYLGASRNVTQQVQTFERLKANEAHLSSAQHMMDLGVLVWRGNQQEVSYQSDNIACIYGRPGGKHSNWVMTRRASVDCVTNEDKPNYVAVITKAERENLTYDVKFQIVRPDGKRRTLREIGSPAYNKHSRTMQIVSTVQDITDIEAADLQLRQAQKMESIGKLTGGIAHDFNNLLAIIQGCTEFMAITDVVEKNLVDDILRAVSRGAGLTNSLLAYARKQPLNAQPVHLGDLARGMLDMVQRSLGASIVVDVQVERDLWVALADPGRIEDAILNLSINARDAMSDGGDLKIVCANRSMTQSDVDENPGTAVGDFVTITFSDTGKGMTDEVLARAIEPFFTTKELSNGSGLGLSTIYGFARQSGGHLCIKSELGRGTGVRLSLPKQASPPSVADPALAPPQAEFDGTGERILLVEDNDAVRDISQKTLISLGYQVVSVADADEFAHVLKSGEVFDLVLCDVVLPGGTSGPQLVQRLRAEYDGIKVVFMSGYSPEASTSHGVDISQETLLSKPFSRADLSIAVEKALHG
jgi:PAS domain S-box-containing protein